MANKSLKLFLERLGLLSNRDVFFVSDGNKYAPNLTTEVVSKLKLIKPDAYYAFNNQPYILFFDLSDEKFSTRENEIHKQVWSFDSAPIIFIIKQTDIEVFNAFSYEKRTNRLEGMLLNDKEILERFSFWNIQSGETWRWLQIEKYNDTVNKKRVNQRLFDNIKEARQKLEVTGMSSSDANTTILRLIFIRYLIDRGVVIKKEFISGETVEQRRQSLSLLINDITKLSDFFEYLNERFNGALFKQTVSFKLKKEQSMFLSQIFDVRKDKITPMLFETFYFDIFDFSIIPVEVISGIYESVIDDETKNSDSAVYTPPFLVEYMLAETVDKFLKKEKINECKILDPACGSGIFLVQSYRRMVDEELRKVKNGSIESARLREIAENNLFGIDLNEQALLVASFSIYIAILDYKEPKQINNFVFPNLIGKNLFKANFFDTNHEYNKILKALEFDFILGNPPWRNGYSDKLHMNYLKQNKLVKIVSDFQLAQSFVLRSREFVKVKTKCALIVTSKSFYNINAVSFKKKFLVEFFLDKFFDLSPSREYIFNDAKNPGCVIFYRYAFGDKTNTNSIKHECLKPNIFLEYFNTIVIEKRDRKEIQQGLFILYTWMFKVALYGGPLDYSFILKISKNKSISEILNDKDESVSNSIYYGDGIKRLTEKAKDKLKKKPVKFSAIRGLPVVETTEIKEYYSVANSNNLVSEPDLFVKSGNNKNLYFGEKILLKARPRNESDIVISYSDTNSIFREKTLGIASQTEISFLKYLYSYFNSSLFTYYQYITSSSWGIYYPEILQSEFLNFPFHVLSGRKKEKLIDLGNTIIEKTKQYRLAEIKSPNLPTLSKEKRNIDELVNDAYEINEVEKDLIDYVLNVSRYQFQSTRQKDILRQVHLSDNILQNYVDVFFKEIERIYEGEYLQAEIYPLKYFIAVNFRMLRKKPLASERIKVINNIKDEAKVLLILSKNLSIWNLTNSKESVNNIFIQKDIKGFENDSFYIIKPNEYKCWHRAIAWYDVAEIKSVIEKAEVETLNEVK